MLSAINDRKEFEAAFGRFRMNETEETCREALECANIMIETYNKFGISLEQEENILETIEVLKTFGYAYCVYENKKPCVIDKSEVWVNNKFPTFGEAVTYLKNWLGFYKAYLPDEIIVDTEFDVCDMKFIIKKEKI